MERLQCVLLLIAGMVATGCATGAPKAQAPVPADGRYAGVTPGSYATLGGWGELSIRNASDHGLLVFQLDTESSGYGCTMSGTIDRKDQTIRVDPSEAGGQCPLTMRASDGGIEVGSPSPGQCESYCGYNGSFIGIYLAVESQCTREAVARQIQRAQGGGSQRSMAMSADALEALLQTCGRTLSYASTAEIRLAAAAAHLQTGKRANCLAVLSPYAEDASRSDEDLTDGMTPAAANEVLSTLSAVRQAIDLCR